MTHNHSQAAQLPAKKSLQEKIVAFIVGLIFGIGLIVSEMVNPKKVQDFLDLFGDWDYSLMLVMVGALAVAIVSFKLAKHRCKSLLGEDFPPLNTQIDRRLIVGAVIFGIGWGIAGICPAPALVLAGSGVWQGVVFVVAMLSGMGMFRFYDNLSKTDNQI